MNMVIVPLEVGRIWGIWGSYYDVGQFHILSCYYAAASTSAGLLLRNLFFGYYRGETLSFREWNVLVAPVLCVF